MQDREQPKHENKETMHTESSFNLSSLFVPIYWYDGALRVRAVTENINKEFSRGVYKGLILDSGSNAVALHHESCEACGGAAHASHVSSSDSPDISRLELQQRTLGDGAEHYVRRKKPVEIFGAQITQSSREIRNIKVLTQYGWHKLAFDAHDKGLVEILSVRSRVPTRGFENVSKSRAGVFGIGPGATHFDYCVLIASIVKRLIFQTRATTPLAVGGFCCVPASRCGTLPNAWCEIIVPNTIPRHLGIANGALCAACTCATNASITHCVIDTGSTYGYLPSSLIQGLGDAGSLDLCITFRTLHSRPVVWRWKRNRARKVFRQLPYEIKVSANVIILGARTLEGRSFAIQPKTSRVWLPPS